MPTVEIILWVALGVLALPVGVFAGEVLLALLPARRLPSAERGRCAVLVPAHNEEGLVGPTVRAVLAQVQGGDRVVVVADNCTDATAQEARQAGADVIERTDPDRRGKGYALAAGVEHLRADPPEVVVILDADGEAEPGAIDAISRAAAALGRPVQGAYLMRPPPGGGVGDRVSALAFAFKNLVRPRGLTRLGAPCLLTGSGMAFPFEQLASATLATGDIVEDMRLGVDLAVAGHPPAAMPGAVFWSVLPGADDARRSQRTRWEHGHLASIAAHGPRLLWHGVARGRPGLLVLALELSVPPMSLLLMLAALTAGAAGVAWGLGLSGPGPFGAGCGLLMGCLGAFLVGWCRFGSGTLRARDLAWVPLYAVRKVPIYVRAVTGRQKSWVRTARDRAPD